MADYVYSVAIQANSFQIIWRIKRFGRLNQWWINENSLYIISARIAGYGLSEVYVLILL